MLTHEERNALEDDLYVINHNTMKQVLTLGELCMSTETFLRFRKLVFNLFGDSNMKAKIDVILNCYEEE